MKKRLVTTLFSVICAASLALSFTACEDENSGNNENNVNDSQPTIGVEVTEEQWNLAFEQALNAENITMSAEAIREDRDESYYSVINIFFDAEAEIDLYGTFQYNPDNDEISQYVVCENSVQYNLNQDFEVNYVHETPINFMDSMRDFHFTKSADNTSIEEAGYFWEYLSEFEFVDGEYRANNLYLLWYEGDGYYSSSIAEIKVEIDSDGYLRYWSIECVFDQAETLYYSVKCKLDNYGTTKIEVPKEVLDAVEEYKNKNN